MSPASPLRPAAPAELADALAYALLYDGKRRVHHADDVMAHITAEYLIQHLPEFAVTGHMRTGAAPGKPEISWVFAAAAADNTPKA